MHHVLFWCSVSLCSPCTGFSQYALPKNFLKSFFFNLHQSKIIYSIIFCCFSSFFSSFAHFTVTWWCILCWRLETFCPFWQICLLLDNFSLTYLHCVSVSFMEVRFVHERVQGPESSVSCILAEVSHIKIKANFLSIWNLPLKTSQSKPLRVVVAQSFSTIFIIDIVCFL